MGQLIDFSTVTMLVLNNHLLVNVCTLTAESWWIQKHEDSNETRFHCNNWTGASYSGHSWTENWRLRISPWIDPRLSLYCTITASHLKLVPRLKKWNWEWAWQVIDQHPLSPRTDIYRQSRLIFPPYVCSSPVVVMLNWRWVSHTVVVVLAVLVPLSLLLSWVLLSLSVSPNFGLICLTWTVKWTLISRSLSILVMEITVNLQ